MRLWDEETVLRAEETDAFKASLVVISEHRRSVESEKQKLLDDWLKSVFIDIPRLSPDELRKSAVVAKQAWFDKIAPETNNHTCDAKEKSVVEWEVSYLRHRACRYEHSLKQLRPDIRTRGGFLLQCRVLEKIAEQYPYIVAECERQRDLFENKIRRKKDEIKRLGEPF